MFLEVSKYLWYVCRVLEGASILDSKGVSSWLCSHYKRNPNGWRLFQALFFHERSTNHLPPHHAPKIRPFPRVSLPRGCKNAFHVCACPAMIPGASTLHCRAKGFFTPKICEQLSPVAHSFWKNATLLYESILTCSLVHPRKLLEMPLLLMVICHSLQKFKIVSYLEQSGGCRIRICTSSLTHTTFVQSVHRKYFTISVKIVP